MSKYQTVAEYVDDLSATRRKQITILRKIILSAAPVTERIKWNAPSYVFNGEDRITFNTEGDDIKVIIHFGISKTKGASEPIIQDTAGIVEWSSSIRGVISFSDMDDVFLKRDDFEDVIRQWLTIV